jgi:inhibitor of cysteine peptidase
MVIYAMIATEQSLNEFGPMADIIATEAQNQTSLQVHIGDTLVIRLPESPTTGYKWVPLQGTAESDEFVSGAGSVGGGGVRVFRFPMKSPGAVTLELGLTRAWEKQTPSKLFKVDVQVLP